MAGGSLQLLDPGLPSSQIFTAYTAVRTFFEIRLALPYSRGQLNAHTLP